MDLSKYFSFLPRHRLTRLGFHFLFVGSFAMLGGALRGFNLLLLLSGLLIAALVVQWRVSRASVRRMSVQRRLPKEAFAQTPFSIRYRISNTSRYLPSFLVRIEDRIERVNGSESARACSAVGAIGGRRTAISTVDCRAMQRGKYRLSEIILSSTFPFGLFNSTESIRREEFFYVYPKLLSLHPRWQAQLISRSGGVAVTARRSGPTDGEFFGLREWRSGDLRKWIHWRTTARLGELAVRQFEQQRRFDLCMLIDGFLLPNDQRDDGVESAISVAATMLVNLIQSPTNRIVVGIAGHQATAIRCEGSREAQRRMLCALAELTPSVSTDLVEAGTQCQKLAGRATDIVIVSPRSLDEACQQSPLLARAVPNWQRHSHFKWINTSSDQLQELLSASDPVSPSVPILNREAST